MRHRPAQAVVGQVQMVRFAAESSAKPPLTGRPATTPPIGQLTCLSSAISTQHPMAAGTRRAFAGARKTPHLRATSLLQRRPAIPSLRRLGQVKSCYLARDRRRAASRRRSSQRRREFEDGDAEARRHPKRRHGTDDDVVCRLGCRCARAAEARRQGEVHRREGRRPNRGHFERAGDVSCAAAERRTHDFERGMERGPAYNLQVSNGRAVLTSLPVELRTSSGGWARTG